MYIFDLAKLAKIYHSCNVSGYWAEFLCHTDYLGPKCMSPKLSPGKAQIQVNDPIMNMVFYCF